MYCDVKQRLNAHFHFLLSLLFHRNDATVIIYTNTNSNKPRRTPNPIYIYIGSHNQSLRKNQPQVPTKILRETSHYPEVVIILQIYSNFVITFALMYRIIFRNFFCTSSHKITRGLESVVAGTRNRSTDSHSRIRVI
jgi:hypothetical protein